MALMIPDDLEHFSTDGERQFYGFLKNAAKPDSKYLAWYLPAINGRESDFIILCRDNGLPAFDRNKFPSQLEKTNPTHFSFSNTFKINNDSVKPYLRISLGRAS